MTEAADPTPGPARRLSWRWLALFWAVARAAVFTIWAVFGLTTQGDVLYYWQRIHLMVMGTPLSQTLIEYPTPVVWFLTVPYWLAGQSRQAFVVVFVIGMLLLDLAFAVVLYRVGGSRRTFAVLFWIVFTFVMGPTAYMRFDLVPAVLGGLAVLALFSRRRWISGALVGLGAALKLWPAFLWPATLGSRRTRLPATVGFLAVGGALAIVSLLVGGWQRLISPLTWQSDRGLQIESIWATPLMLIRGFTPGAYDVALSRYQAFEITGAGSSALLAVAGVAAVVGYVVIAGLYLGWLTRPARTIVDAALLMVAVITVVIVTNKTFSPQYMMWLGGPLAGLVVAEGRAGQSAPGRGEVRTLVAWVLGLTLATQLVYPVLYQPLVHGGPFLALATVVLVLRNLGMVAFTVWLGMLVVRTLGRGVDDRAARRRELRKEGR